MQGAERQREPIVRVPGARVLVVGAPYYRDVVEAAGLGARAVLAEAGCSVQEEAVPGAFEIPAAIALAARTGRFEGFVALGCVVRGETTHYDYVCGESARALMDLSVKDGLAIGYGILTVNSLEQAHARVAPGRNKGEEAALACVAMMALKRRLQP